MYTPGKIRAVTAVGAAAFAFSAAAASSAMAAPTDVDRSFGNNGSVLVGAGGAERAFALVTQRDGQLVGTGITSNGQNGLVFRLSPNGTPDAAFGTAGIRAIDSGDIERTEASAIQPDGKIVVVGSTSINHDAAVYRLNPDGSFDSTFDGDGARGIDSGAFERAEDVAIQPDGKIVVVGVTSAGGGDVAVYRLNPDGSFDRTFDGDGARGIDSSGVEVGEAVALQADGKIVVAGETSAGNDVAVYRLNPDGTLDNTFDGDGARGIDRGDNEFASDVLVQPDGKILVAGTTTKGENGFVARLNADGTPDASYRGDAPIDAGAFEKVQTIVRQPDGKIVVGGSTTASSDALVVRMNADGSRDASFAPNGQATIGDSSLESANGIVYQRDGKIVLAGDDGKFDTDALVVRIRGDFRPARGAAVRRCAGVKATIVGTPGRDRIRGTRKRDVIVALGGRDVVRGLAGNDIVCGGRGNDVLRGGRGRDLLIGGPGRDRLIGGPGKDATRQ
jgi:uncharacterized delta-60 repeat protein